jgi:protein CpxP
MRNVIAAVMASTLALSAYSQAAEVVTSVNWLPGDEGDSAVARAICLTA